MYVDEQERFGALYRARSGKKWSLNDIALGSGSRFQILLQGHWIDVVIEYDHGYGYYAIPFAVRLHNGLTARFPGQWGD